MKASTCQRSFIRYREKLVLKPNDEDGEQQTFVGAELDESGWERALKSAMRSSYVVQETSEPVTSAFATVPWR